MEYSEILYLLQLLENGFNKAFNYTLMENGIIQIDSFTFHTESPLSLKEESYTFHTSHTSHTAKPSYDVERFYLYYYNAMGLYCTSLNSCLIKINSLISFAINESNLSSHKAIIYLESLDYLPRNHIANSIEFYWISNIAELNVGFTEQSIKCLIAEISKDTPHNFEKVVSAKAIIMHNTNCGFYILTAKYFIFRRYNMGKNVVYSYIDRLCSNYRSLRYFVNVITPFKSNNPIDPFRCLNHNNVNVEIYDIHSSTETRNWITMKFIEFVFMLREL